MLQCNSGSTFMQLKSEKEAAHLRSLGDEQERLAHVQEVIEDQYLAGDEQFAAAPPMRVVKRVVDFRLGAFHRGLAARGAADAKPSRAR